MINKIKACAVIFCGTLLVQGEAITGSIGISVAKPLKKEVSVSDILLRLEMLLLLSIGGN
jgi:hypothetical protein